MKSICQLKPYLICTIILLVTTSALAQSTEMDKERLLKSINNVEQRVSDLKKVEPLNDSDKSELKMLHDAITYWRKTLASHDRAMEFSQATQETPALLTKIQNELNKPITSAKVSLDKLSAPELHQQLESARLRLDSTRRERDQIVAELSKQNDRQRSIPEESAKLLKRIEEVEQKLKNRTQITGTPALIQATLQAWEAETNFLRQTLTEYEQELRHYAAKRDLLRTQHQLSERLISTTLETVEAFEKRVIDTQSKATASAVEAAAQANQSAERTHPAVQTVLRENKNYATELSELPAFRAERVRDLQAINELLSSLKARFTSIQTQVNEMSMMDMLFDKLRHERQNLPDVEVYQRRLKEHQDDIIRIQARRAYIESRLIELTDIDRAVSSRLDVNETPTTSIKLVLKQALSDQKESHLRELLKTYDAYLDKTLLPLVETESQLIDVLENYADLLDYWKLLHPILNNKLLISFFVITTLLGLRYFVVTSIRRKAEIYTDKQRIWMSRAKNGSVLLIFLSVVFIWWPELRTAALSITAIAVALVIATKELILCISGSFLRASANTFSLGDWIEVGPHYGEVIEQNIFSTTIQEIGNEKNRYDFSGKTITIPNSMFLTTPVKNMNFSKRYVFHKFTISMDPKYVANTSTNPYAAKDYIIAKITVYSEHFIEVAKRYNAFIEKRSGIDIPDPAPRVFITTSDLAKVIFNFTIFCPTKEAVELEQKIIRDLMEYYYSIRSDETDASSDSE